ncbi:MAG: hypothetical protein WCP55_13335 [Lentisphaerota bacterium]
MLDGKRLFESFGRDIGSRIEEHILSFIGQKRETVVVELAANSDI